MSDSHKVQRHAQIQNFIKQCLLTVVGTAILAFGTAIFIIPYELVTGGLSGLALVLHNALPWNISVNLYITILTWILFVLGLIVLGKEFALKTFISSLCYPVFVSLFSLLVNNDVYNGLFVIQNTIHPDSAIIVAAIFGGVLTGLGVALVFLSGGSSGGCDILAFILCKFIKKLNSAKAIFFVDAAIIILGIYITNDLVVSLLGITSAFVCSLMIDKVFLGSSTAYVAHIVSSRSHNISQRVIFQMNRTTTIVDVVGAYSNKPNKMVIVSFNLREYQKLMNIVNDEDPKAFIQIFRSHEIHGEGWTYNK